MYFRERNKGVSKIFQRRFILGIKQCRKIGERERLVWFAETLSSGWNCMKRVKRSKISWSQALSPAYLVWGTAIFSPAFGVKVCEVLSAKKPNPGLPWWLRSKEPANEGDMSSISGPGRSHVVDQLSLGRNCSACALKPGSCNQWAYLS